MILLPYPISGNRYWRSFRGRMVVSAEARAYKEHAAWVAMAAGWRVLGCDVAVEYILHPKMTKGGKASKTRCDLDNVLKVIGDAMNGVAWIDDKQVVAISARIGAAMKDGGLTVIVRGIDGTSS